MIQDQSLLNRIYQVVEKNIDQLAVDQVIHLRDRINQRILRTLEMESWMFAPEPTSFTRQQFGLP